MYFNNFPYTFYSLDNRETVQLVKNILLRVVIREEIRNNFSIYDEYDIKDGETPEILADKFYDNPELHWIILHLNEVIDPRFNWVQSVNNLVLYTEGKYTDKDGIHHYTSDATGEQTNGNVYLNTTSAKFDNYYTGNVVINNTGLGVGYITSKISSSNVNIIVTNGGFKVGDQVRLLNNANAIANVTLSSSIPGITPVTNYNYEDQINETRRTIKILKAPYVQIVMNELKNILEQAYGQ